MKTPGIKEIGNKPSCARALISGSSQASGHRINLDTHVLNTRNEKIVRVPSEKQLAQSHRVTNVAGAYPQSIQHKSTVFAPKMPELRSAVTPSPAPAVPVPVAMPLRVAAQVQAPPHQGHQAPAHAAPPKLLNASNKTRKKQAAQPNPTISPSSIQAAAIAAGGRLATASTAANFLKVAQSKNAVHIRSLGATSLKPSASFKASIVVEHGTQPGGSQHLEPLNASAVHDVSGVAAVNQSGPLAGACSETKKALSTALAPVPCDSEEKEDDSEFCVITIDDLFPEDAKQPETVDTKAKQPQTTGLKANQPENADPKVMQQETMDPKSKQSDTVEVEIVDPKDKDMLEFDQYVASQGGHLNTDDLNKSKCTNSVSQAQGLVGSQQKLIPADGKGSPVTVVGKGKPVTAGVAATGRKTKFPVSHLAAGTPRGIVDTVNANAPNKTLVRRAAIPAPVPAGCQVRKDAMNSKGNQMTPGNAGSGVPASSQTSVAAQAASKANLPSSSSQAKPNNMVVNGGNRLVVNPPSSSQASAAVNDANRAATPQSSNPVNGANNREVNPPPSSQASTAVNGAANKGNVPAAARPP
ncbi:Homeodomain-like superfamily protein [Zea mays]|uniref:Homeodomain-like superfamily protein n=1 Tax=Zea mays TaxID=4577 RepID=A0A1D6Q314_MAIZE|nr:Homeodomain-like superfamily protein [Zea mays]